ncbi:MAG: hypothetical protein ACOX1F_07725 [Erysipelotrichaceae bacterium]
MNRKIAVIGGLIGLLIVIFISSNSNRLIEKNIEIVEVKRDNFVYDYKTFGVVNSKSHYYFFNGYIKNIYKRIGEEIKEKEKVISFINEYGKSKDLLSETDGFLYQIENNCIIIKDLDYFVTVEMNYEKYCLLEENDSCFIGINNNYYQARIIEKAQYDNRDNKYKVIIETDYDELIFSQHVNVVFHLQQKQGLTVDKRALNNDSDGYFLIAEEFKNELNNIEKYRIEVKVIMCNDELALISAPGIENKKVCIISDYLKELVNDQNR